MRLSLKVFFKTVSNHFVVFCGFENKLCRKGEKTWVLNSTSNVFVKYLLSKCCSTNTNQKIDFFPCNEINKYETSSEDASSYI